MNKLVEMINSVFGEWKKTFDPQNAVLLAASVDAGGQLCINGRPIFAASGLQLISAESGIDRFCFFFDNGRSVTVTMTWPEDGTPFVDGFSFGF